MTSPVQNSSTCICGNVDCDIPFGYCYCRCGRLAPIASKTCRHHGWIKGHPKQYINNHVHKIWPQKEDARPFKIDGVYCRLILLTQGMYAIVNETDYNFLMQWKWHAFFTRNKKWYALRRVWNPERKVAEAVFMHSLLVDREGAKDIDHINDIGLDNRRLNLRPATRSQNQCNKKMQSNNTSGYKGVSKHGTKWVYDIRANGNKLYRGGFETALEAFEARCKVVEQLHGEFTRVL